MTIGFGSFRLRGAMVAFGLLIPSAMPLMAGTLASVAWDFNGYAHLVKIDTGTFSVTDVGPLGVNFEYGGLAYNTTTSTLYMVDGRGGTNSLYTVNLGTGAATLVGSHGLTDLFGLAFDSANGNLYGSQFLTNRPLLLMNPTTGAATPVGSGISASNRISPIAYDSLNDTLYGLEDCLSCAVMFTINVNTGVGTVLQSNGLDTNNSGMTFDPILNRLWDLDVDNRLSYFNPLTGAQTQVTVLSFNGKEFDGLAFIPDGQAGVPEPTSLLLIGSGLAWLRLRRR